jgi:hypothetical protein
VKKDNLKNTIPALENEQLPNGNVNPALPGIRTVYRRYITLPFYQHTSTNIPKWK